MSMASSDVQHVEPGNGCRPVKRAGEWLLNVVGAER